MVKNTVQCPLVGGYNFCFDCVCAQASSPNRGYRGWSHTMTFPLWGLGVRSTELQLETVKVLETCGCDIPQKCSHGMSYVQIFTSSMFAIKNDGITSYPFSSSCCCHWAKSHLTPKSLLFSLYSSRNTASEPYQRLMLWKYELQMMANTLKTSVAACPVLVNYLSTSTHCCLPRQMMCTRISWLTNIFCF